MSKGLGSTIRPGTTVYLNDDRRGIVGWADQKTCKYLRAVPGEMADFFWGATDGSGDIKQGRIDGGAIAGIDAQQELPPHLEALRLGLLNSIPTSMTEKRQERLRSTAACYLKRKNWLTFLTLPTADTGWNDPSRSGLSACITGRILNNSHGDAEFLTRDVGERPAVAGAEEDRRNPELLVHIMRKDAADKPHQTVCTLNLATLLELAQNALAMELDCELDELADGGR